MSKYNILVLAITVLLLGYITYFAVSQTNLLKNRQPTQKTIAGITPTPIPATPFIDNASPDIVAASFYTAYQNCLKLSSSPNSSLTLIQYCQTNTRLTIASYNQQAIATATNSAGIDPVFCANQPPALLDKSHLKLGSVSTISNTESTVPIIEVYDNKTVTINFSLEKDDLNQWKVAKITCQ